jgi:AcrR family transcriptional regulator
MRAAVAEEGPGVGVREIADRADLSVTTLYRHFGDKQSLIDALSIHRWEQLTRLVRAAADRGESALAILRILDTFSRMVTADDAFIVAAGVRVGRTPAGILPFKERFEPLFAGLWATAQARGQVRRSADPGDAMELAGMIRDPRRRTPMLVLLANGICTERVDVEAGLVGRLRAGGGPPSAR